jgi:chromosomal replication initiation ATPase DnaA
MLLESPHKKPVAVLAKRFRRFHKRPLPPLVGIVGRIFETVSGFYGVPIADIRSDSRSSSVVHARHVVMYILRRHANRSLREAACLVGKIDHTTALGAMKKLDRLRGHDRHLDDQLQVIVLDLFPLGV